MDFKNKLNLGGTTLSKKRLYKMKNCYAMVKTLFCAFLFLVNLSFAQSAEVGQAFNRFSGAEDGLNPLSGVPSFSKNIASISAGAASISLDLAYSGNVTDIVQNRNDVAPTSWVGLGWTLGHARITVDHAGTMWNGDDSYYLESSAGVRYKILQDKNGKWWVEGLPYWLVERKTKTVSFKENKNYSIVIGWLLTDESGVKYTYGDMFYESGSKPRNSTEYTIASPDSLGIVDVIYDAITKPFPNAWNLQKIEDVDGNTLSFTYDQYYEYVKKKGVETKSSYTKEIYLKSIESSQGGKIEIVTKPKDYEREFIDLKGNFEVTSSSEPDAFIDPMERRFLSQVKIYGKNGALLKVVDLCYEPLFVSIDGAKNLDYTKRLLTQVIESDSARNVIQKEQYAYYKKDFDEENRIALPIGMIDSIIGPNCGVVKYEYKELALADIDPATGLHMDEIPLVSVSMGTLEDGTQYIVGYNTGRGGVNVLSDGSGEMQVYFRRNGKWVYQQTLKDKNGDNVEASRSAVFFIGNENWFVYKTSTEDGTYYPYKWNGEEWVPGNRFTDFGSHDVAIVGPGYLLTAHIANYGIKLRIPWAVWTDQETDVYSGKIEKVDDDDKDRKYIHLFASRNHFGIFYKEEWVIGNSGNLRIYSFTPNKHVVQTYYAHHLDDDNRYEFLNDNTFVALTEGKWATGYYAYAFQWEKDDDGFEKWTRKHLIDLDGRQGTSAFQAFGDDYFVVRHNDNDDMSILENTGDGWRQEADGIDMVHGQAYDPRTEAMWEAVPGYNYFVALKPRIKKKMTGNKIKKNQEYQLIERVDGVWKYHNTVSNGSQKYIYAGSDWFFVMDDQGAYVRDGYEWRFEDYSQTLDGRGSNFMNREFAGIESFYGAKEYSLNGDFVAVERIANFDDKPKLSGGFTIGYYMYTQLFFKKKDSFRKNISSFFVSKKWVRDPVVDKQLFYEYDYLSSSDKSATPPVYDYATRSAVVSAYKIIFPDGSIVERFLCDEEGGVARGQVCKENYYPPYYVTPTRSVVRSPERYRANDWPKYIYLDRMASVSSTVDLLTKKEEYTYADGVNSLVSKVVLSDRNTGKNISETVNVYAVEKYKQLEKENRRTEKVATYQCVPDCEGTIASGNVSTYFSDSKSHMRVKELWKYTPETRESDISFNWSSSSSSSQNKNWTMVSKITSYCDGIACETEDQLGNKTSELYDNKKTGLAHASIANAGLDQVLLLPGNSCNFDSWSECDTVWLTGRELENIPAVTSAAYGRFAKEVLHISKTKKIEGTLEKAKPTKYRFSAWVQGTARNTNSEKIQLSLNSKQEKEFTLTGNNTWQYIEWETPSPRSAKTYVLTLSTTDDTDIHLQDVRFVPVDASVDVTFWDMRLSQPIATVNDRSVGSYIEYDIYGRVTETYGELPDGTIVLKNKNTYVPGACAISFELNNILKELRINGENLPIPNEPGTIELTLPNSTDELYVTWTPLVAGEKVYYRLYDANLTTQPNFEGDCCSSSEMLVRDFNVNTMILDVAVSNTNKPYKVILHKSTTGWVDYGKFMTEGYNPTYASENDVSSVNYLSKKGLIKADYKTTGWTEFDKARRNDEFVEMVGTMNNGTNYIVALPNFIGIDVDPSLAESDVQDYVMFSVGKSALGFLATSGGFSNFGQFDEIGVKSAKHRITTSKDNKTYVVYERTGYSEEETDFSEYKNADSLSPYDLSKMSLVPKISLVAKLWDDNSLTSMGVVSDAHVEDVDVAVGKNNVPFVAYIGTLPGLEESDEEESDEDDSDEDDSDDLQEELYELPNQGVIIKHYSSTKKKWVGFNNDDGDLLEMPDGKPLRNVEKLKIASNGTDLYVAVLQRVGLSSQFALKVFKLAVSNSKLVASELIDNSFSSGTIAYLQKNDHFDLGVNGNVPFISFENDANREMITVVKYDGSYWRSVGRPAFAHVSSKRNSADLSVTSMGVPYVVFRENVKSDSRLRRDKIVPMKYSSSGDKDLTINSIAPIQGTDLASSFRQYILNYEAKIPMDVESITFDLDFRTKNDIRGITIKNKDVPVYKWKKTSSVKSIDTDDIGSQIPKITIPLNNNYNELKITIYGDEGVVAPLIYSFVLEREFIPALKLVASTRGVKITKLVYPNSSGSIVSSSSVSGVLSSSSISTSTSSKESEVYQIIPYDGGGSIDGENIKNICLEFNPVWVMYIQGVLFSRPVCLDYDLENETFIISSSSYSAVLNSSSSNASSSSSSSSEKGNRIKFYDGNGNVEIVDFNVVSSSSPAVPVSSSFDISEWLESSSSGSSGASSSGSSNASSGGSSGASSGGSSNASSGGSSGASSGGSSGTSSGGSSNASSSGNVSSSSAVVSSSSFKHDSQLGDVIDGTAIPYDYYVLFGYKFIATSNLNFENTVSASSGYYVTTNSNVAAGAKISGTIMCSGNLMLNSGSYVEAVVQGGSLNMQSGARYGSKTQRPVNVPSIPKKSFATGNENINVWSGQSRTLSPGTYGDVSVYSNAKLTLESGVYYFKSFNVYADGSVIPKKSSTLVQLWVKNNISLGDRTSIMKSHSPNKLFIYGNSTSDMYVGVESETFANIVYPNGKVNLAPRSSFKGKVWSKFITSGANSVVK